MRHEREKTIVTAVQETRRTVRKIGARVGVGGYGGVLVAVLKEKCVPKGSENGVGPIFCFLFCVDLVHF